MRAPLLGTVDGKNAKSDEVPSLQLKLGKVRPRFGVLRSVAELFNDNKMHPRQLTPPWKPWGQRRSNHAACSVSMCVISPVVQRWYSLFFIDL